MAATGSLISLARSKSSSSIVKEDPTLNDRKGPQRTSTCHGTCCSSSFELSTLICNLLSLLNLVSLAMKIPFIVLIVRMVIEQVYRKLNPVVVPTTEPAYEDDVDPKQAALSEQIAKSAVLNGAFFLVALMSVLLIQLTCFIHFWKKRKSSTSSCKDMAILFFYILIMLVWLLISFSSMIVQEWKYYLSLTLLLFKSFFHGTELFGPPPNIEITLFRITFWLDLVTYVLTVIHLMMTQNEDVNSDEERDVEMQCNRKLDLIRELD